VFYHIDREGLRVLGLKMRMLIYCSLDTPWTAADMRLPTPPLPKLTTEARIDEAIYPDLRPSYVKVLA
jgi:hypothetical protein